MHHRSRLLQLLLIATSLGALACPAAAERRQVVVGVIIDGPWLRNAEIGGIFKHELRELLKRDYELRIPADKQLVADWTPEGVRGAVDRLMADPEVDLVLGLGVIVAHEMSRRGPLPKPGIAPYVLDIELQQLPYTNGTSGVENLNYLTATSDFRRMLGAFRELVEYRRLVILSNPHYAAILEGRFEQIRELGREWGFEARVMPVEASADEALARLPEATDAVFVAPLLHLPAGEFERLVSELKARRLPSFSVMGDYQVRQGLFAGLTPDTDWQRVARRVALNAQRILKGEDAGGLPVEFELSEQLTINMTTARAVGRFPSFSVMTEAVLVAEERQDVERKLSLDRVVEEALATNLTLLASKRAVAAGHQDVRGARAVLRPQLELDALGRVIDEDRAQAGLGSAPERSLDAALSVTQLLWSDQARANLGIQQQLQAGREADERRVLLDVVAEAATAYLDVLRAKTLEQIRKENIRLTRSNLKLARIRRSIGMSGPGEVYRWEAKIASDRVGVITANAQRNVFEIQLNRILDRPGEEPFETTDVTLEDLDYVIADPRLNQHINNKWSFAVFRDFMVETALANSPELARLDAALAAQERALLQARRAFWSPSVAASAELGQNLAKAGAGTDGLSLPPTLPLESPQADDTDWSIGVSLTFPIFSGGAKGAAASGASEELARLRLERAATADLIEQSMRAALHLGGSSHAAIKLSNDAAEAARKNLDLVKDAYSQGDDRLGATEYVATLSSVRRRSRLALRLAGQTKRDGPDALIAWADAVPEDAPNQFKEVVFAVAAGALAALDPERAAPWYESHMQQWYSTSGLLNIAGKWAYFHDPKPVVAWIETLPIEEAREGERIDALREAFRTWAPEAPDEVEAWIETASGGPMRDVAIEELARASADASPAEALRWAQQIGDEDLRRKRMLRYSRAWFVQDPEAAETWLEGADVSPGFRRQAMNNWLNAKRGTRAAKIGSDG